MKRCYLYFIHIHTSYPGRAEGSARNVYKNAFTQNNNHFIGEIKSNLVNMPKTQMDVARPKWGNANGV